jgi:S1-C subfamily serine protease
MIVTASHVVPPEIQNLAIDVTFDDQSYYPATVYKSEPNFDAGIIQCPDIANKIPALQLGDSDTLEIGDLVIVISAPEGFHDTATFGRVSNTHMSLGENAPSEAWQDFIFIDADIMEGSSGGMVLGTDGLVYGLVMGVTGQHAESGLGENSISPSNKIKQLLS